MTLTEAQVREIRELAAKATAGPLEPRDARGLAAPADCINFAVVSQSTGKETARVWTEDDARYLAACDPQTVTALCDAWLENAALRALLAQAREALEPWRLAAELIPADQEDFKVVAHVPAGPHAMAFRKMGALLTAGDFRRARTTSTAIKEATRS